jgi:hypothetical protein
MPKTKYQICIDPSTDMMHIQSSYCFNALGTESVVLVSKSSHVCVQRFFQRPFLALMSDCAILSSSDSLRAA